MNLKPLLKLIGLSFLICIVPTLLWFLGSLFFFNLKDATILSLKFCALIWFVGSLANIFANFKLQREYLKELGEFAKKSIDQSLSIPCAYCKTNNVVRIDVENPRPTFKCASCKNESVILIDVKTAQITGDIDQTSTVRY